MKNTLSFIRDELLCIDSIADGTNTIFIEINVGNVTSPKIVVNSTDYTELIPNSINNVEIGLENVQFQYIDDDFTGTTFTITFIGSPNGSLLVTKESDYELIGKYTTASGTINVIDNLESFSTTDALSANQGRILNQYVSNGKTLVAAAITDKGVDTEATDTFEQMAYNISAIPTGGDEDIEVLEYSAMSFIFVEHYTEVT